MKEQIKIEPPKLLDESIVVYWFEKEGRLVGNQKSKALKFIKNKCIKPAEGGWDILPIKDYNITTHKIRNGECSCQWFKKGNGECSHLMAVRLWQFMEKWNEGK